jgi:hypothetical protein
MMATDALHDGLRLHVEMPWIRMRAWLQRSLPSTRVLARKFLLIPCPFKMWLLHRVLVLPPACTPTGHGYTLARIPTHPRMMPPSSLLTICKVMCCPSAFLGAYVARRCVQNMSQGTSRAATTLVD